MVIAHKASSWLWAGGQNQRDYAWAADCRFAWPTR